MDSLLNAGPLSLSLLSSPESYLVLFVSLSACASLSFLFSAASLSRPSSDVLGVDGALKTCLSLLLDDPVLRPGLTRPPGWGFGGIITSLSSMTRLPIIILPLFSGPSSSGGIP